MILTQKKSWINVLDKISYEAFDENLATSWMLWLQNDTSLIYITKDEGQFVTATKNLEDVESFKRVGNSNFFKTNNVVYRGQFEVPGVINPQKFETTKFETIFTDGANYYYFDGFNPSNQDVTLLKKDFDIDKYTEETDISEYYDIFLEEKLVESI